MREYKATYVPRPSNPISEKMLKEFIGGKPFDLEIGAGVGFRAIDQAKKDATRALIAIEKTTLKFKRFERRVQTHPPFPHLLAIHADAISWITHCVPSSTVDRLLLFYPNPERKNPEKRWFRMPFFTKIVEILKPSGEIVLVTNIEEYMIEAQEFALRDWNLKIGHQKKIKKNSIPYPRTHFEKKYLESDQTCFETIFQKTN